VNFVPKRGVRSRKEWIVLILILIVIGVGIISFDDGITGAIIGNSENVTLSYNTNNTNPSFQTISNGYPTNFSSIINSSQNPSGGISIQEGNITPQATLIYGCGTYGFGNYELAGNIGSTDTCLIFTHENTLLNCPSGYGITYASTSSGYGIKIETSAGKNVQIHNCTTESADGRNLDSLVGW